MAFFSGRRTYEPINAADAMDARPDFSVSCYAVSGLFRTDIDPATSPKRRRLLTELAIVPAPGISYPPAFILSADDDTGVAAKHALRLYHAVRQSGAPAELHVLRRGGHGVGIRNAEGPIARWPELCGAWLRDGGSLGDR